MFPDPTYSWTSTAPPPPDPPDGALEFPPPTPPPADVIVENTEFEPDEPGESAPPEDPPAPTVIGKEVTETVKAVPCEGDGPYPEAR